MDIWSMNLLMRGVSLSVRVFLPYAFVGVAYLPLILFSLRHRMKKCHTWCLNQEVYVPSQ